MAGGLASAITGRLFELGWIMRPREGERVVKVTDEGVDGLAQTFGLPVSLLKAGPVAENHDLASA